MNPPPPTSPAPSPRPQPRTPPAHDKQQGNPPIPVFRTYPFPPSTHPLTYPLPSHSLKPTPHHTFRKRLVQRWKQQQSSQEHKRRPLSPPSLPHSQHSAHHVSHRNTYRRLGHVPLDRIRRIATEFRTSVTAEDRTQLQRDLKTLPRASVRHCVRLVSRWLTRTTPIRQVRLQLHAIPDALVRELQLIVMLDRGHFQLPID